MTSKAPSATEGYGLIFSFKPARCANWATRSNPIFSAILIVGVALGTGYKHILLLIAFLGVWRCIQDYFNSPRIMGKHLELHPLAALFGVLAGAEIGGIIGVYLSIPIMATARIFFRRWQAFTNNRLVPPAEVTEFTPMSSEQAEAVNERPAEADEPRIVSN